MFLYKSKNFFFSIWNHHKCLSYLFPLHLNTYVMGLQSLWIFYFFSAGIDFRRQNLTSTDVRFRRLQSIPALQGLLMERCGMCIEVRRLLNMIYQTAINPPTPYMLHGRLARDHSKATGAEDGRASGLTDVLVIFTAQLTDLGPVSFVPKKACYTYSTQHPVWSMYWLIVDFAFLVVALMVIYSIMLTKVKKAVMKPFGKCVVSDISISYSNHKI